MSDENSGTDEEPADGGLGRRRRWVVAVAVAALLLGAAGVGASMVIKSPAQAAAEAGAPAEDVLTAAVEHRVLVSSVITRGQVRAGQTVNVAPQVSAGDEGAAGAVITKLAVGAHEVLRSGRLLMEVSGRPVFVLRGGLPVYRDLRPGSEGEDVEQLQKALRELGHPTTPDADGTFGAGTKAALGSFYASIGYDPLPAQDDDGEGLKAASAAVRSAERALEDAKDSRSAAKDDGDVPGDPRKAVERATEDLDDARAVHAEVLAKSGPMLPAGEAVFLKSFPARVNAVQGLVGGKVSGTAMTLSSGRLVVQAYVPEYQKGLLRAGQDVEIYSEVSGVSAGAKVARVADTQTAPAEESGAAAEGGGAPATGPSGYLVQITPDKALDARLNGQDVRLTIEAASTGGKALVVPVTAITAGADGRTVVTVRAGSGAQKRVEIRPGTSGDGFVAVVPVVRNALRAGDRVVTGVRK
ncbi:peptidoglycan-binding protein [Streptomyces sp. NBC_00184]|uniref:peptidoglycan-binding domain-containing protein n=1 Tax=unclassified Streptomyces TaxID=2593676 RepID=UPI002E2C9835|nr:MULTISPECIES: peptidoglycan-binding domain-containing protein [unclassified Streptomyces]